MASQYGPYLLGYTRPTMAYTIRSESEKRRQSTKIGLSQDCGAEIRPHEFGICSNCCSACNSEYVPVIYTHRPPHQLMCLFMSQWCSIIGESSGIKEGKGVTRLPQGNLRLNHLLNIKDSQFNSRIRLLQSRGWGAIPRVSIKCVQYLPNTE